MDKSVLKNFMAEEHFTSYSLSELLGVSERTVQGWFSGRPIPYWVNKFIDLYKSKSDSVSFRKNQEKEFYDFVTLKAEQQINNHLLSNRLNKDLLASGVFIYWHSLVCNSDFFSIFDYKRLDLLTR